MPITKVKDIIRKAEKILNDEGAVRWTRLELQDWINDGYKDMVAIKPDVNSTSVTVTLAAGTRQKLADAGSINLPNALMLLDVVRNMATTSNKRSVKLCDRAMLDQQLPDWQAQTASVNITHWMRDVHVPKEFTVNPPAAALAQVEIIYSSLPAQHSLSEVALDPAGADTTVISIDDTYATALLDYVLYRAFSKDAVNAASTARAESHFAAAGRMLAGKTQIDAANSRSTGK